jgi:aspartyl-tRNA(Asn)/glutamyl-tRNA(Gln) amidotransferase subunit C
LSTIESPQLSNPRHEYPGYRFMKISRAEVEHIADLARLELGEREIEQLQDELSQILEYVEQLNELDTTDVLPTSHVVVKGDVLCEDKARPSLQREDVLANAPRAQEGFFRVHAIFEKGEQ